jgi:PTS system ascorbate-specific IIA component
MNNRIFIVAHAPLAQALKACAMHVYPECANEVLALDVQADDTPEQSIQAAQQLWAGVPDGDVLVLTDVLGATPANVAQQWARDRKAKIVAGVNLPMLLRSVCYRHESLEALAARAHAGGTQGVMPVGSTAPQNQTGQRHAPSHRDHQQ